MQSGEFDSIVEAAYKQIPARFRRRLQNVAVVIEAEPSASWRNVAIGLGVLALVVAGFLVLLRRRSN